MKAKAAQNGRGKKICWVVTGAGHFLREAAGIIPGSADVYLTRAAREVAARYGVADKIASAAAGFFCEADYSSAPIIYFSMGVYSRLVIAPATANTVAKCVLGIADSLASNFFAQASKSGVECAVLPTDVSPEMVSATPSGKNITIRPRAIDLENTEKLALFHNVVLLRSASDLASYVERAVRNG